MHGNGFGQNQATGQGKKKGAFTLSIAARSPSVKVGDPVWVDATLKNASDYAVNLWLDLTPDQGGYAYAVDVRDERGSVPPTTEYAKAIAKRTGGEGGYVPLDPGKALMHKVEVSKLYDLSRPGKYTIQFRKIDVFDKEAKEYVTSNPITVSLTP
jgi:hypothetical protein